MRFPANLIWASVTLNVYTASAQALVYTSESVTPPNGGPPSISPITAKLLFAQRLGLSQYHSLEDTGESDLDILSTYGGSQPQIFQHEERTPAIEKLLLIIESVSHPEGSFYLQ